MNGVVRGGGYQTRSQYARSDMRYTTGKGGGYDYRGFRSVNGVYRGSAYQTVSSMTRDAYRRGGQASLSYAQGYIGFRL